MKIVSRSLLLATIFFTVAFAKLSAEIYNLEDNYSDNQLFSLKKNSHILTGIANDDLSVFPSAVLNLYIWKILEQFTDTRRHL